MFNGKMKAVTFSYDDGITQDKRLISLFNKYGLKATFNINSAYLGTAGSLVRENVTVAHVKPRPEEVRAIYEGHEIASHTLHPPLLTGKTEEEIIEEVEQDRLVLSELAGYEVKGFAYPCGGKNYDEKVAKIIKESTGIKYARTIEENCSFDLQDDLFTFKPTVHHLDFKNLRPLAEEFVSMKPDSPKIFYIWGHSYEFDIADTWGEFEDFCKFISGRSDIFYGTNSEVLL